MRRNAQLSVTGSGPRSHGHGVGLCCLALLVCSGIASVAFGGEERAAKEAAADLPSFLFQPLYAGNVGSVYGVYEARHADLILVEGGFDSGFQTGMVCQVGNGGAEVGEIMLVEVRNNCSAALILELASEKVIEPGHSVRIKTVKF